MKKSLIPAVIVLVLALVAAIGSQGFLGPCVHEDGSFGACHWAGRAELGVGLLLAALALLGILVKTARRGLYLAMLPTALLGILTPGTLISLCAMDTMRCRALMRPAMTILFALSLVAALIGLLLSRGEERQRWA
ncbi:MAG: DUF4418 family protein [Clostridia bacterium]|nr:DUF4418 family protein [Clostridia bacterium]